MAASDAIRPNGPPEGPAALLTRALELLADEETWERHDDPRIDAESVAQHSSLSLRGALYRASMDLYGELRREDPALKQVRARRE